MKLSKPFFLAVVTTGLSAFLCLLVLEIMLHFMPVNSYIPLEPVTKEDPVVRAKPYTKQTYSAGWYFDAQNKSIMNAQGYNADFDFENQPDRPLIAVVGDSYIEARMVPFEQTLQQRLNVALGENVDVYGVGVGGAPMSQYLMFAQMMRDKYHPDFMIVSIVGNDFDESLPQYKNAPRFHYFVEDENGQLKPSLIGEYRPSFFKELISRSALVRYLYFNLNLSNTVNKALFTLRHKEKTQEKETQKTDQVRISESQKAIDAFLKLLPEYAGLSKRRILITVDAHRGHIYKDQKIPEDDYFLTMRTYLLNKAKAQGYKTLDLYPVFARDYKQHAISFDFQEDRHWNGYAHGVVMEAILSSGALPYTFRKPEKR